MDPRTRTTTGGAVRRRPNGPERLSPGSWFPARTRMLRPIPGDVRRSAWVDAPALVLGIVKNVDSAWWALITTGGACGWTHVAEL